MLLDIQILSLYRLLHHTGMLWDTFTILSKVKIRKKLYEADIQNGIHSELGQRPYTGVLHQFYIQNDLLQKFTSFS
jgi:hypothetical protein